MSMTLSVSPAEIDGNVNLVATSGSSRVKVWESATKTGAVLTLPPNPLWTTANYPHQLYLEGYSGSGSVGDVQFMLEYSGHGITAADNTKVTVISAFIKKLSFKGDTYHVIKKDDGSIDYAAPHWEDDNADGDADDQGEKKYPVAYRSSAEGTDSYMTVSVEMDVSPAAAFAGGTLMADNSDGYTFSGGVSVVDGVLGFAGGDKQCSKKFDVGKIDYYGPPNGLKLSWKVSMDGGSSWCKLGDTKNVLYVTCKLPTANPLYETPLKIGCDKAKGKTQDQEDDIISAIWSEFTDLSVSRIDGVQMVYWGTSPVAQSLQNMLAYAAGHGSCLAWSELLDHCMKSQGLGNLSTILEVLADDVVNPGASGFLVKNWLFDRHIRTGTDAVRDSPVTPDDDPVAPTGVNTPCILPGANGVLNSTKQGNDDYQDGLHAGTNYPYEMGLDSRDQTGVAGQANPNPPGAFENHFVCEIKNKTYDPSYGIGPFSPASQDHENAAIDGIYNNQLHCKKDSDTVRELKYQ